MAQADLLTAAQFLKGVGADRAGVLAKLGLRTARDILFFFPRDYRDLTQLASVQEFEAGAVHQLVAHVEDIELRDSGGGRSMLGVLLRQENDYLRAVWFNQPYLAQQLRRGQRLLVTGTPKLRGFRWEMHHPKVQPLLGEEDPSGGLQPVYPLTEGVSQRQMQRLVQETVASHADLVGEIFPDTLREKYRLLPISDALRQIHGPQDRSQLEQARRRFIYQELFTMQLALGMRRALVRATRSPPLPCDAKVDARISRLLPFELTEGQRQAVREITADMANSQAMNRLLQGDVGSGKTMIAAYAMLVAIANHHQAVLMAPTEILARQHLQTFRELLKHSQVRIGLLTGSTSTADRRLLLDQIRKGEMDLVIGTHTVVQDSVQFLRLGLAVVDEGHKFGVKQRAKLRGEETEPHYLVMTATPIPRTISMTQFGDLEVSLLREMPPGRQPVHTYVGTEDRRSRWWEFVRKKLGEGRQAYVIAPLVDEANDAVVTSAEQLYERLVSEELDEFRVDILHGRMRFDAKDEAMRKFREGETQVLVATSLVEVGVDVPNANVMTIENAERFGLAQLHQLRGRVGRGKYPGFVCVYSPSDSPDVRQRLEALATTPDGFELAEIDFQLRGPGDLFSTKQHGLPRLRIANLQTDTDLLQEARADAQALLLSDPQLEGEGLGELRKRALLRYGKHLELGDVG